MVYILSALWQIRIRGLWKLPDGRNTLWGKLGLVLMGGAMLSKSLIQFRAMFPPCCLTRDQTMVEVMKIMATSFKRSHASTATLSAPDPEAGHHWPMTPLETPGHSQASLGQSLVGSLPLSPASWCLQGFVCALQESVSPVLCKFCNQIPLPSEVNFPEGSQSLCQIPRSGNTLEYYSAIKRNTFESVLMRLMNLEPIIQSEVSQKEKDNYHILMHIYGI